jgi:hypothetical protein
LRLNPRIRFLAAAAGVTLAAPAGNATIVRTAIQPPVPGHDLARAMRPAVQDVAAPDEPARITFLRQLCTEAGVGICVGEIRRAPPPIIASAKPKASRKPKDKKVAAPIVPAPAALRAGGFRPTDEQTAIVAAARGLPPAGCLKVIAFAGAGKTTTLKQIAKEAGLGRGIYIAFNKVIAIDAGKSFPPTVEARTLHSVAYRAHGIRQDEIDQRCLSPQGILAIVDGPWLAKDSCGSDRHAQARLVGRIVSAFCASADLQLGAAHVRAVLDNHVYRVPRDGNYDPELMARREMLEGVLTRHATAAWARLGRWRDHRGTQINHDIYLKAFELDGELVKRTFRVFDFLMLDEAQDLNPVMRSVAQQSGIRLIAVGDPWQQIYSWRGAEDALGLLPGERLYLSQSFRFGEAIAAVARRILASKPSDRPRSASAGATAGAVSSKARRLGSPCAGPTRPSSAGRSRPPGPASGRT